ncbi:MAG: zf-HC2 domain-containing protein [Clostridia bacterium]|nr:zf-HC2 domain-containing protein [Clostridia bacterium]
MKCSQATALFDEYLNNTIQPSDEKQLTEHLKTCASCQKQWEAYRFFFENASIEEDFLVPSQLNAKIKYTIHQAKNNKKVPFFLNKQLLAGVTACSFLLVGTLWGASHYQQLKEASLNPQETIAEPMVRSAPAPVQQQEDAPQLVNEATPEASDKTVTRKIQPKVAKTEVIDQAEPETYELQNKAMVPEPSEEPVISEPVSDNLSDSTTVICEDKIQPANEIAPTAEIAPVNETPVMYRRMSGGGSSAPTSEVPVPLTEDTPEIVTDDSEEMLAMHTPANVASITLSKNKKELILSNAACTQISEICYQVELTKQELEELIGEPVTCPENTLSFWITFE